MSKFMPLQQQIPWLVLKAKRECDQSFPVCPSWRETTELSSKDILIEGFGQVRQGLTSFPALSCNTPTVTYRIRTMLDNAPV